MSGTWTEAEMNDDAGDGRENHERCTVCALRLRKDMFFRSF